MGVKTVQYIKCPFHNQVEAFLYYWLGYCAAVWFKALPEWCSLVPTAQSRLYPSILHNALLHNIPSQHLKQSHMQASTYIPHNLLQDRRDGVGKSGEGESGVNTWNTVTKATQNVSKLLCCSGGNLAPNICIPRRVKIKMKRKSIMSRDMMERHCEVRDNTRFLMERQYLQKVSRGMAWLITRLDLCCHTLGSKCITKTIMCVAAGCVAYNT